MFCTILKETPIQSDHPHCSLHKKMSYPFHLTFFKATPVYECLIVSKIITFNHTVDFISFNQAIDFGYSTKSIDYRHEIDQQALFMMCIYTTKYHFNVYLYNRNRTPLAMIVQNQISRTLGGNFIQNFGSKFTIPLIMT